MADQNDVRRIAMALPGTCQGQDDFAFSVPNKGKQKGFIWSWKERVEAKKPRVPSGTVIAVRVANLQEKEALLASGGEAIFTEPHYNGYPAILVRLPLIDLEELEELIVDAWRCQAPRALVSAWERAHFETATGAAVSDPAAVLPGVEARAGSAGAGLMLGRIPAGGNDGAADAEGPS